MPHLEGLLLSQTRSGLRLLLTHSAVVIGADNVESVDVLDTIPLPAELKAVRVHYRDELLQAHVLRSPSDDQGQPGILPFAMATRSQPAEALDCPRYRSAETEFLHRNGLGVQVTGTLDLL